MGVSRRTGLPTRFRPDLLILRIGLVAVLACAPAPEGEPAPRSTLFVGVDVSGSFEKSGRYDDAMAFAARYIHAHLEGHGGLERPRALFVGSIGGEEPGEPQAFHPIHDFRGKGPAEIEADLRSWFPPDDNYTDFNAFFQRASTLVKRQNLALAPITLVLLSDGVPDVGTAATTADAGPDAADSAAARRYRAIDLDPLEYLARNVTVRLLYPDPAVAVRWERDVPRDRVRMWTVDAVVMEGWSDQLAYEEPVQAAGVGEAAGALAREVVDAAAGPAEGPDAPDAEPEPTGEGDGEPGPAPEAVAPESAGPVVAAEQPELWRWMRDNVDFRVRRSVF